MFISGLSTPRTAQLYLQKEPEVDDLENAWPGHILPINGIELYVRDTGESSLPALVFLHGLGGYSGEWWPAVESLRGSYRLVAFDQRGQGRSTTRPDDVSREAFVRDAVAVIEHLSCGPAVLVGQSMGAHTALLVASLRPDLISHLVLIEGGLGGEGAEATKGTIDWFQQWPTPFPSRTEAIQWFEGNDYSPNAASWWADGLKLTETGLVPRFATDVLRSQLLAVHVHRRQDEWRSVVTPTLLIKGADGFIPRKEFDDMLASNPHASMAEVSPAGHDVHLDAPKETARLIRNYVGR